MKMITVRHREGAPRGRSVIVEQNGHVMYRFTVDEARDLIRDLEAVVARAERHEGRSHDQAF